MTAPAPAAYRLAAAMALGLFLGLFYDALTPLRRRHSWWQDLIFVGAVWWAWVYWSFGICGGDIRMGGLWGMAAGFFLWRVTLGQVSRGIFYKVWGIVFQILEKMAVPAKKSFLFCKKIFASWRKWVTIEWRRCSPHRFWRKNNGKTQGKAPPAESQAPGDRGHRGGAGLFRSGFGHHPRRGGQHPAADGGTS